MNQFNVQQIPYGAPPLSGHLQMLPPQPPQPEQEGPKPKKQRVSRACDRCHNRACKCERRLDGLPGCQACLVYGVQCTFARPQKRRGMKPKEEASVPRVGERDAELLLAMGHQSQLGGVGMDDADVFANSSLEKVRKLSVANEGPILSMVDAYVEVLYPLYPFFHVPTLKRRVKSGEHHSDPGFLAEVMAICAISAAKLLLTQIPGSWIPPNSSFPGFEVFFDAAEALVSRNLGDLSNLSGMRTCALLALYGLHTDKLNILHRYLGTYHSIVALNSFHDERNWPVEIGVVEVEMRRRLFWSMYSLEVYTALIFGNIIRVRADRIDVSDPSEVSDEFFSDQGYNPPGSLAPYFTTATITDPHCWIYGWNFNVDLYRVLEESINKAPRPRPASTTRRVVLSTPNPNHENDVLTSFIPNYDTLSSQFKYHTETAISESGNVFPSKFELQAASITTTVQLIRMALFNSRPSSNSAERQVMARNLVDSIAEIPILTLKIINTDQFFPLIGVVGILKSAMQDFPISGTRCKLIRNTLAALEDIYHRTESGHLSPIFSETLTHQLNSLNIFIASPQAQLPVLPNPEQTNNDLSSPSNTGVDATAEHNDGNLDPELSNTTRTTTNGEAAGVDVSGMATLQVGSGSVSGSGVGKKYDLFTSGGVLNWKEKGDLKENEQDVWVRLPEEVAGIWDWGIDVRRGFGRV